MEYPQYHNEVLAALSSEGDARLGRHIAKDRRSDLDYAGIRTPARRKIVSRGFSFYELNASSILRIWHDLWMHTNNGDVMFCAVDYYRDRVRRRIEPENWQMFREWVKCVENWAHSDGLCTIYSRYVEAGIDEVWNDINQWNRSKSMWYRRISIVSLIHYSGKNALFLPFDSTKPFIRRCIEDEEEYMQKAVGWVLREFRNRYQSEVDEFLNENIRLIPPRTLTRALERASVEERKYWRMKKSQAV